MFAPATVTAIRSTFGAGPWWLVAQQGAAAGPRATAPCPPTAEAVTLAGHG